MKMLIGVRIDAVVVSDIFVLILNVVDICVHINEWSDVTQFDSLSR